MKYKIIRKKEYKKNKNIYLNIIKELFINDNSKIANIEEFTNHLEFIFNDDIANDAILVLNIENNKIISMVNFLQYNNIENHWCLFSLFTLKSERNKGYGEKMLRYGVNEIKNLGAKLLISGIEEDNIESIKLHKKVGFINSNKKWDELVNGFPKNHTAYILKF